MEEKTKQTLLKLGWILFLILLAMIIGAIFLPKLVHAATPWPLNQSQTCALPNINLTGIYCDAYWCQNFITNDTQNCTYQILTGSCSCTLINLNSSLENQTIIINCSSNNITMADYQAYCNVSVNCSSTNITIADFQNYCNITNNQTNLTDIQQWCKNYTDTQMGIFRDSNTNFTDQEIEWKFFQLMGNNSAYNNNRGTPITGTQIIIIVAIIVGGAVFLGWRYSVKKKVNPEDEPHESIKSGYKGKELTNKQVEDFENKDDDSEEGIFESKGE
jgi:hypothetical protein